ncbi:hypothetical protein Pan189_06230 [Stratiformator vulcanicus]|uniref:Uncharacterized protein n=1 Tax=Stratiformator vulcanicus TaxID=2527980 RepID=A0A517QXE8_9PLAN|nr:hypothetical protein Pan189_06230 [Stratiformator vulcanicus]
MSVLSFIVRHWFRFASLIAIETVLVVLALPTYSARPSSPEQILVDRIQTILGIAVLLQVLILASAILGNHFLIDRRPATRILEDGES